MQYIIFLFIFTNSLFLKKIYYYFNEKSFKKTKKREKKIIKPVDKETERMNDLSKMIDDKFKNKLVNYRTKKEHLAKFIFWFSS